MPLAYCVPLCEFEKRQMPINFAEKVLCVEKQEPLHSQARTRARCTEQGQDFHTVLTFYMCVCEIQQCNSNHDHISTVALLCLLNELTPVKHLKPSSALVNSSCSPIWSFSQFISQPGFTTDYQLQHHCILKPKRQTESFF